MTPYEIRLLLHYYASCDDHPDMARQPPIWLPTVESFIQSEVLALVTEKPAERCYKLTERGKAYCEALQLVPLPKKAWAIEWPIDENIRGNAILHRAGSPSDVREDREP